MHTIPLLPSSFLLSIEQSLLRTFFSLTARSRSCAAISSPLCSAAFSLSARAASEPSAALFIASACCWEATIAASDLESCC